MCVRPPVEPAGRCSSPDARRDTQIGRRIDGVSGHAHLEKDMRANTDAASPDDTEFLAGRDGSLALSKGWGEHAEVAVDADEAIMLHEDFKPARPLLLDTDDLAGAVATMDAPGGAGRSTPGWKVPAWGWSASTLGPNGEEMQAGLTGGTSIGSDCGSALAAFSVRSAPRQGAAMRERLAIASGARCQVRSVFLVSLISCFFSQALCSACALVSAAVLGRLTGLAFGVDSLITRDIRLAPGDFDPGCSRSGRLIARRFCGLRQPGVRRGWDASSQQG